MQRASPWTGAPILSSNQEGSIRPLLLRYSSLVTLSIGMEVDSELEYSREDFATTLVCSQSSFDRNSGILTNVDHPMWAPHPSPAVLAQFAELVYTNLEGDALPRHPELSDWKVLTTARNTSSMNGYFGAAFHNSVSQQVVVAHRGTANLGSVLTDLNGVIFKNHSAHMSSATTFADRVKRAILEADRQPGKRFRLSVTGHSLGGWLAQTSGFSVKFLQAAEDGHFKTCDRPNGLHAHIVAFDSPGCKDMLGEIVDSYYCRHGRTASLETLDITSYLSAPNVINTFGLHVGSIYRVKIDVSTFTVIDKYTPKFNHKTHSIYNFTKAFAEARTIHKMKDWPLSKVKNFTEYNKFHQKVCHANEYHLELDERDESNIEIRYKAEGRDISGSLRMFSDDELKLLEFWIIFKKTNVNNNEIQKFLTEHNLGSWETLFLHFLIDIDNRTITCDSEGDLDTVVRRTKLLVRWFLPELTAAADRQSREIPKIIYSMANQNYLDSLPDCLLNFADRIGLREFLQSADRILRIVTEDCDLEMLRLFGQLRGLSPQLDEYGKRGCQTFLHWKGTANLKAAVDIANLPEKDFTNDNLLVINCAWTDISQVLEVEQMFRFIDNKKLILVSGNPKSSLYSFSGLPVRVRQSEPFETSQLTKDSQNKLFKMKMLEFGNESFSVADFIGEKHFEQFSLKINHLIDTNDLKEILRNNKYVIKIENSCPNLIDSGVNISTNGREVSVENSAKTDLLVMSGDRREETSKSLAGAGSDAAGRTARASEEGNAREETFKQTVSENPNNKVYRLEADDSSTAAISFYMRRRFHHQMVFRLEHFAARREVEDIFIFQGVPSRPSLASLLQLPAKENILTAASVADVDNILKKKYEKPVHLLKLDEEGERFLWKSSLGSLQGLRPYAELDSCSATDEGQLSNLKRKVVIIADVPGMGKSTSLASVSRLLHSDPANWVIWIDLKHFKFPSEDVPTEPRKRCEFLLRENLAQGSLPRVLLQLCLHQEHPRQVYLMFDGFDEIKTDSSSENYARDEVLRLLEYLATETRARVWVTARLHKRESLEDALSTFAVTFEKIEERLQRDYLENFWRSHLPLQADGRGDAQLKKCARDLYSKAKEDLREGIQSFMGVPLQMRMLAEVFLQRVRDCVESRADLENTFRVESVFSLYERFINAKYTIYCKGKLRLDVDEEHRIYRVIVADFTKSHRRLGFSALFPESAKIYREDSDGEEGAELCRVGLVQSGGGGREDPEFLHRTLAEYFCADQIVHWLSTSRWPGRASAVELLLTDISLRDSNKIIRMFMNNFLLLRPMYGTARDYITSQIVKLWSASPRLLVNTGTRQTALHVAAKERNTRITDCLIGGLKSQPDQNSFVAARDRRDRTALHEAAASGHLPMVQYSVEKGGDTNSPDEDGRTALHEAARAGHLSVAQYLVEKGGDINSANLFGSTVLHTAVAAGHLPVVQYLVEMGGDINSPDKYGRTALHLATDLGYLPLALYLVQKGGDINSPERYRRTAPRSIK